MSLYPSLEDMQVDKLMVAQQNAFAAQQQQINHPSPPAYTANPYPELGKEATAPQISNDELYPDLYNYMGLELSADTIAANMPEYLQRSTQVANMPQTINNSNMVAPLSGTSVGLQRAQVTNGIRELVLCKGADKKIGLRTQAINKGIFVCLVIKNSPAAIGGLRFGDQILQINGQLVAGYSVDDVHKLLKKSDKNNISFIIRDRPFERAVTLHKDSTGSVGFQFSNGKITTIVKDSSAARNGLLIEHHLLEVNGQNVVSMKDKEVTALINAGGNIVTVTIIPTVIYDTMMKKLSTSWLRGKMDHSLPEF